jgi:cytochrome c556
MPRRIPALAAASGCALAIALSTVTLADPSPEDAKDYRQAVMSALGGHARAVSMHVRGLLDDPESLRRHAEALALTASELDRVFPPGSNVGDSEALPAIWEKPEAFAEAVAQAREAAEAFAGAARSGDDDAIRSAFREVGSACRGCHDEFREEHDH